MNENTEIETLDIVCKIAVQIFCVIVSETKNNKTLNSISSIV